MIPTDEVTDPVETETPAPEKTECTDPEGCTEKKVADGTCCKEAEKAAPEGSEKL
jgi:hypothetical protein